MLLKALEDDGTGADDRGMDYLISNSAEKAEECFQKAEGVPWAMTDPLLEAFTMMGAMVMQNGIPEDQLHEFTGKCICPVCLAMGMIKDVTPEGTEMHWTSGLADHLLTEYRERKIISKLQ